MNCFAEDADQEKLLPRSILDCCRIIAAVFVCSIAAASGIASLILARRHSRYLGSLVVTCGWPLIVALRRCHQAELM